MNKIKKINLFGLMQEEIADFLQDLPSYRAKQITGWVYRPVDAIDEMHNLPASLREELKKKFYIGRLEAVDKIKEKNTKTVKYVFKTEDENYIETVLMRYRHGYTICVSSQVGCAFGCTFCASASNGLIRNLTAGEILSQVYEVSRDIGERIGNVVLMGSGEPLDNYDNVLKFIRLIQCDDTLKLSKRAITLSTCGVADQIIALADSGAGVRLSLSLHSPFDAQRAQMMPGASRYSVAEVLRACRYYAQQTKHRVTIEYALISGQNDTESHARALGECLKDLSCLVNLIPINETDGSHKRSSEEQIEAFRKMLEKQHIEVTVRRTLGSSINAACGQLTAGRYEGGDK